MQSKQWRFVSLGVLLGALLVTSSRAAEGGINSWTSTNGPNGGPIGALAIDPVTPATLYAGTDSNGVFKSTNGGASWSAVNTGLTVKTVSNWPSTRRRRPRSTWGQMAVAYSRAPMAAGVGARSTPA